MVKKILNLGSILPTRWWLLSFFILASLFVSLGSRGLNEPDEGRYANMGLEMLEPEHSLLEPVLSDLGHFDKPPMIYWVTALSFKCFGQNEFAARMPSTLGALFALIGLGWMAYRLYGEKVSWWSILVCGTLLHFWALARWLTPDMLLTGFCLLGMGAWAEARFKNAHWGWWFLSLIFWSLAWWTKATPMFVPLLALTVALLVAKDKIGFKSLRLYFLIPGILILGSPWFVYIMMKHHDLVDFFFHRELVGRMAGHVDGRKGPFYYYLLIHLILWLPWWPFAAYLFKQQVNLKSWKAAWDEFKFEIIFIVVGMIVFSSASSKLPTYTLTLTPLFALLVGRLISFRKEGASLFPIKIILGIFVLLIVSLVTLIPHYETQLGRNSSLNKIAAYLKKNNVTEIYSDTFWPSLEFYFDDDEIIYAGGKVPLERQDDQPAVSQHFHDVLNPEEVKLIEPHSGIIYFRRIPDEVSPVLTEADWSIQQIGDFWIVIRK